MLPKEIYVSNIFSIVKKALEEFRLEKYSELNISLKELLKYITSIKKTTQYKYGDDYVEAASICLGISKSLRYFESERTTPDNTAMDKEIVKKLITLSENVKNDFTNFEKRKLLSQNLWKLIDGWNDTLTIELVMARLGTEIEINYKQKYIPGN